MKDSHLTLRLPRDLARTLARWARTRGVAKSALVREVLAAYLAPAAAAGPSRPGVTAGELAARWGTLPRLTVLDAAALERDVAAAREALPPPRAPWD
ncbi:MAG: CopG family transcriptional regulator [Gemmatimonadales bacterium]